MGHAHGLMRRMRAGWYGRGRRPSRPRPRGRRPIPTVAMDLLQRTPGPRGANRSRAGAGPISARNTTDLGELGGEGGAPVERSRVAAYLMKEIGVL